MFSTMTSSHRLLLAILALVAVAILLSTTLSGTTGLLVAIGLCIAIWLLRPLIMPPGYGAMKVRTLSIIGLFGLVASWSFWADVANAGLKALAASVEGRQHAPWLAGVHVASEPSIAVLMFVTACMWIIHHYMAPGSISGDHPVALKKEFPEPRFADELASFCNALKLHILGLDDQSNWSPDYYVELEAEVEVTTIGDKASTKRLINLQSALRRDRGTQAFLILGDPGAGKSVALRKLAKDMLDEVPSSGRIPLYINLREWLHSDGEHAAKWTEKTPPKVADLQAFVMENVKARGDVFTKNFVDKYFLDLWQHGRIFFIFDSFDEIPDLLDVNEESWLIETLSEVFNLFICANPRGRGVLASRMFRRPTQAYRAGKSLDIRPMSDDRIIKATHRYPGFSPQLCRNLFTGRNDLVPIVRNPFLLTLLGEWVDQHHSLPDTQSAMYEHYLRKRLDTCADRMAKLGLDTESVLQSATDIACFIFRSNAFGLEAPVELIGAQSTIPHAPAVMNILRYARIARVTENVNPPSFAFVHRRFLEYFVTTRFLSDPDQAPIDHIPTDARGRDAMVLYAQLCSLPVAETLAQQCWTEITNSFEDAGNWLRAIHSLRFLTDAFTSRRNAVAGFDDELADFIAANVTTDGTILRAKFCLEATGLLSEDKAVPILKLALDSNNSWLQETAFRACRRLPRLSKELRDAMVNYLVRMPLRQFWANRESVLLSLSLSDATADLHRVARSRVLNMQLSILAAFPAICAMPYLSLILLIMITWMICMNFLFKPPAVRVDLPERSLRTWHRTLSALLPVARNAGAGHASGTVDVQAMAGRHPQRGGTSILSVMLRNNPVLQPFRLSYAVCALPATMAVAWLSNDMSGVAASFAPVMLRPQAAALALLLCLSTMLCDWYLAGEVVRAVIGFRVSRNLLAWTAALLAAYAAAVYAAMQWVQPAQWVMDYFFFSMLAIFGTVVATRSIGNLIYHYRDYQAYRSIRIGNRMPREEIARALGRVRSERLRLALVRNLAGQKTVAYGAWPADFQLRVSEDPAITELARLEERWLKLDR